MKTHFDDREEREGQGQGLGPAETERESTLHGRANTKRRRDTNGGQREEGGQHKEGGGDSHVTLVNEIFLDTPSATTRSHQLSETRDRKETSVSVHRSFDNGADGNIGIPPMTQPNAQRRIPVNTFAVTTEPKTSVKTVKQGKPDNHGEPTKSSQVKPTAPAVLADVVNDFIPAAAQIGAAGGYVLGPL
jgi:hypothetical protein